MTLGVGNSLWSTLHIILEDIKNILAIKFVMLEFFWICSEVVGMSMLLKKKVVTGQSQDGRDWQRPLQTSGPPPA